MCIRDRYRHHETVAEYKAHCPLPLHGYECGLKPNTISTYMRMLRSIYNRGAVSYTHLNMEGFRIDQDYYVVKFTVPEKFVGYFVNELKMCIRDSIVGTVFHFPSLLAAFTKK